MAEQDITGLMRTPARPRSRRILFIHENFPAQFGVFADWLMDQGWEVKVATAREGELRTRLDIVKFKPHRAPSKDIHPYLAGYERAILNAQAFARAALELKARGYTPDIVVAHSGWGVGSFAKDIWPETLFVPYFEWYYSWPPTDQTRHSRYGDEMNSKVKSRVNNSPMWLDFSSADRAICPTAFQAAQFPAWFQDKITVLHDGVDTAAHRPGPRNAALLARLGIPADARIVTYLARGMEPARGFPEMMEAVAELQKRHETLHTIIVGNDRVAYGNKGDGSWKQTMLDRLDLDEDRLHFTGLVSMQDKIAVFQTSDVHLYLTAPFVLSWSALEAMSCGCAMVASDVEPVREVMRHDDNALLVDMNDIGAVVAGVERMLAGGAEVEALRQGARDAIVSRYDAKTVAFPQKLAFLDGLLAE